MKIVAIDAIWRLIVKKEIQILYMNMFLIIELSNEGLILHFL